MSRPSVRPWCPRCGVRWVQVGDRTGHCSGCHRTFSAGRGFEAHRKTVDGRRVCVDPATLLSKDDRPRFVTRTDGAGAQVWHQPASAKVPHWPSPVAPSLDDDSGQDGEDGEREGQG